jgi:hypothetical protein
VDEKREAYATTDSLEDKREIAETIVNQVHSQGGRFLRQTGRKKKKTNCSITYGEWCEVSLKVSMEKAKQCLREKPTDGATTSSIGDTDTEEKRASLKRTNDVIQKSLSPSNLMLTGSSSVEGENRNVATVSPPSQNSSATLLANIPAIAPSSLPFMMAGGKPSNYFPGDARLLLFQSNPLALRQQILSQQQSLASSLVLPTNEHESSSQSYQVPLARSTIPYRPASAGIVPSLQERLNELRRSVNAILDNSTQKTTYREPPSIPSAPATRQPSNRMDSAEVEAEDVKVAASETASSGENEDDLAAFLLSSLAVTDRPVITEEQEALERATLSDAEKANILADFFGIYCSESVRHNKKARKDLDQASLAFLVKLMRADLDSIPVKEKPALVEAMAKARPEEFSDERLEKFLRCEGMNTKVRFTMQRASIRKFAILVRTLFIEIIRPFFHNKLQFCLGYSHTLFFGLRLL